MSALERAVADVERGEYGLARRRLYSYLRTKGYDADVLAKLGQICHDMHDPHEAGRFWLTSVARGEQVENAIALFCRDNGPSAESIVGCLPYFCRLSPLDTYPSLVRTRLDRLGLGDALTAAAARETAPKVRPAAATWVERLVVGVCALVAIFGIVCGVIGLQ